MAQNITAGSLIHIITQGTFPTIAFTRKIEEYDGYFDNNMIGRIVRCELPNEVGVVKLVVYTKPYTVHNDIVANDSYIDKNGNNGATAREAGYHPETKNWKSEIYIDMDQTVFPFEIVSEDIALLS